MKDGTILVYARQAKSGAYERSVANSVHLAYSIDEDGFSALNKNFGVVFPKAEVGSDDTIIEKGAIDPYIFYAANGWFGITAIRVDAQGISDGAISLWLSDDLIRFSEYVLETGCDGGLEEVTGAYLQGESRYEVRWRDTAGNCFRAELDAKLGVKSLLEHEPFASARTGRQVADVEGIIPGNSITVSGERLEKVINWWSPVENIGITVPESVVVESAEEIESVAATAVYSDGSFHRKPVKWDTSSVDITRPGIYTVSGIVRQQAFRFPLAVGYADPVLFNWKGLWYFISTNDNTGFIGLYVREANSIDELFAEGIRESLILDKNERKGFLQTFWAPEFHVIGGELYILFAVSGEQWGPQCHMMRLKPGGSITNAADWDEPVRVLRQDGSYLTTDGITLDMTYFQAEGGHYLVWSYRLFNPRDTGSMLYIAAIDPKKPWRLTSEPVLLSRPLYGWENNSDTINNEGPYALVTEDKIYLTYSGGSADRYTYVLGLLTIDRGLNPLEPENWEKSCAPVLSHYSIPGEYGPGHNSFYVDQMGNTMIAYHALKSIEDGNNPRSTAIRRVHFNAQGVPLLEMSAQQDLCERFKKVSMKILIN